MTADFFQFHAKVARPRVAPAAAPGKEEKPLSVTELTNKIERAIKSGLPPAVLVQGEVSNFGRNKASGHVYFTLKDPGACLDCVLFKSDAERVKFQVQDGMELLAHGRIGVYGQRGRYQLYVSTLRPLGQGALELAFQQLRAKLEAEGLFAAERKKPLPRYPLRIALITSREAAALHDMLKVLRAFPWLRLMLYPAPVQGDGAATKIAAAIHHLNSSVEQRGGADLILLARGGGSLEDLWAFNEEIVARAVAASGIPVVTGIGHEVDVSIADLVADHHAHTPTEAARYITLAWQTADGDLTRHHQRLRHVFRAAVSDARQRLKSIERHETFRRPLDRINTLRQLLDDRQRSLVSCQRERLADARHRLQDCAARLQQLLPVFLFRLRDDLSLRRRQLDQAMRFGLTAAHERVARASALFGECHPKSSLRLKAQRLAALSDRLERSFSQDLRRHAVEVDALERQLHAVSPEAVLRRGYSITTRKRGGLHVKRASELKVGDRLITRFGDGQVESTVQDAKQLPLFENLE
jgi:exodeoxyribonuclease VII large subunit